jgi:hypothetical protein
VNPSPSNGGDCIDPTSPCPAPTTDPTTDPTAPASPTPTSC